MNKAIILDRDGTINEDNGFIHRVENLRFIPGVIETLRELQRNFKLIIITNQSGISKGYYTEADFQKLNDYMLRCLKKQEVIISKVYYCPHKPEDNCECRKPKTKLLLEAMIDFNINPQESWCIGDKERDVKMGRQLGFQTLQIGKDIQNLSEVLQYIK